MKHKALLAFSGGLDTSYCVLWLNSQGHETHTVTVDTGGFSPAELERIHTQALALGAASHTTVDARGELFDQYLRHLIAGNVLRGGLYPLSVSAERVCQARRVVAHAKEIGATALVHGSTGAGNRALAPEMALIAPIRELAPSRAEERAYLAARGFEFPEKLESYSINEGMWGTSVGGKETLDPWQHLPAAAYPGGEVDPMRPPQTLEISFARGVPCALDGKSMAPVALVQALNEMGLPFGIGRGIHLGDTIMGIKGRVGFEAPAAHILIAAHRELEKLVLTGKQTFWKESLGNLYGSMLHEGHFFDPLCRDLEAFLDSSQTTVTGDVRLQLHPLGFHVEGVRSLYALVRPEMASYGESTRLWSGPEAAGFAKIFGVPQMVALKARPEQP